MGKQYTSEAIEAFKAEMLEKIPQGWTVRAVLAQKHMCGMTYFFATLLPGDDEFAKQYARAMELRADFWADELLEIADDGSNDWMERELANGLTVEVPNPEVVARSKLRVETRKWLMGKAAPKKYGEKLALVDPTNPDAPAVFTLKIDNS